MRTIDISKTIAIASDHAGFLLKEEIKKYMSKNNLSFADFGTHTNNSVDYPDYAHKVAKYVETEENSFGILICGSANGVCMTANKHNGIRASICWNEEISKLARQHNNSNIICLPARFLDIHDVLNILEVFMNTDFEGGRHQQRINKIDLK